MPASSAKDWKESSSMIESMFSVQTRKRMFAEANAKADVIRAKAFETELLKLVTKESNKQNKHAK